MNIPIEIEFNGVTYRLMGGRRLYYLSQSSTNEGRKGAKGLHVAIWEAHHGRPVPDGYEVHHIDGDTFNNDPGNLDCLTLAEHRKTSRLKDPAKQAEHLAQIRPLAAEWHRSEEGRAWHSEHAKHTLGRRKKFQLSCLECGTAFESVHSTAKFCSRRCWNRHAYATRVPEVVVDKCKTCGNEFTAPVHRNKNRQRQTCSRSCARRLGVV